MKIRYLPLIASGLLSAATASFAQNVGLTTSNDTLPVEVHSDTLDVYQNENKAVFRGNVIATRGEKKLRAAEMTVFYRNDHGPEKKSMNAATNPDEVNDKIKANAAATATGQGIYRINAEKNVVFTTPEDTATGEKGVYDVDKDTIELFGDNVTLVHGQNVLKGTHVVHNMTTNRSVLTSGEKTEGKPARVHGLFVPEKKNKQGADKSETDKANRKDPINTSSDVKESK